MAHAASVRPTSSSVAAPSRQVAVPRLGSSMRARFSPAPAPLNGHRVACVVRAGKGGVMDSPTYTTTPGKEKSLDRANKKSPPYKVMLHNDNYNRREYVVKVLLKVVEGLTVDDAVVVMQEAHETGVAMVVACAQEVAEKYCESLRLNGLTSTIEPDC